MVKIEKYRVGFFLSSLIPHDKLADHTIGTGADLRYDLTTTARQALFRGSTKDIGFPFAPLIKRTSSTISPY